MRVNEKIWGVPLASQATQSEENLVLNQLLSDPAYGKVLEFYRRQHQTYQDQLHQSLSKMDLEQLGRLCHKIKGSAGAYGFTAEMQAADQVTFSIKTNAGETKIRRAVQELSWQIQASQKTLDQALEGV